MHEKCLCGLDVAQLFEEIWFFVAVGLGIFSPKGIAKEPDIVEHFNEWLVYFGPTFTDATPYVFAELGHPMDSFKVVVGYKQEAII
jgi:hypothetical protein